MGEQNTSRSTLLPELRSNLAIYLHPHDLSQMTLVSKAWHHAYTPFLYSHIPLQNQTQALAFLTPESKAAFLRYRQHIRGFRTRSTRGDVIQQFLNTIVLPNRLRGGVPEPPEVRLTELYLTGDKFRKNGNDCVIKILEACSSTLRSLQLDVATVASNQHQHLLPLLRIICDSMTRLQHLSLFNYLVVQIQPLVMRLGAGYSPAFTPLDPEVSSAIFVRFLQSCSSDIKIYGLNLKYSWEFIHPNVTNAVATVTGTRPRYFEVAAVEFSPEEDQAMADEISSLWKANQETPNNSDKPREAWTSIQVKGCPLTSPTTFGAILESCQHGLQNLHIYLGERIANQDIQTILHTGTALRRLEFHHNWPLLDHRVMLQSTWNCTLLTYLNIHITNIPRPDVMFDWKADRILPLSERAETTTTTSSMQMDESRRIQREVYTRLATLVNLEYLQLGAFCPPHLTVEITIPHNGKTGSFDRGQQLNCLEMSLDSGLDILSGMKSLKMLYVHSMEHRIGIREMKWFERELPNFQSLFGIRTQTRRTCLLYGLEDPGLDKSGVGYDWS
ncbi:hypothetical protein BGZ91_008061 [Linnemannia elongata]|nr:hypothetical protein BGZ91_008061 [Linnemannia elongata]